MQENRTKNSIVNICFSLGFQFVTLVLGFVNRTVFLQCLGVEYLGISGLFSDILNMLSLADLGFGTAMTFSMYKPLAEKNYKRLAGLVQLYKKIYRFIALTVLTVGIAITPFLQYLVNLPENLPLIKIYYLLYLANTVSSYLVVYKTSILSADQKEYVLNKYRSIFSIVQTVCMTLFLWITHSYVIYLCVQVVLTYAQNFFCSHVAEKQYPYINQQEELPKGEIQIIFKTVGSVFLYKVSSVLLNATDNTLISVLLGTTMVGFYSNYTLIINKFTNIVNTIFYSLTASLGNLIVKENEEKRYHIFLAMQSVSMVLSTVCVSGISFLISDFIRLWLGRKYVLNDLVLSAIVCNLYFSISLLPIWVFREATGLYRKTKYVMLATAVINLVLSVILGKIIGLAGIIFATAIARLTTYFWYEPYLLFRNYFGQSCSVYFKGVFKSIVVTICILVTEYICVGRLHPNGWILWLAKAIFVCIASFLCVFILYRKSEGFQIIFEKVKKCLSKNVHRLRK